MRRGKTRNAVLLEAGAAAAATIVAATGAAGSPGGPLLTGVAAANTRSPGYAPASMPALRGEEQFPGERVPRRAVVVGQRVAVDVVRRHQRDPVRAVGIEVDPAEEAGSPALVALEDEVRAVVVAGGRPAFAPQDEVGVLVGLGLRRLDPVGRRRRVTRRGHWHVKGPCSGCSSSPPAGWPPS